MSRLRRYTVTKNKKGSGWILRDDKTKRVKHTFRTKANAKKGGVIKGMLGAEGGTVRFQKERGGGFDEERTYPRRRDPPSEG